MILGWRILLSMVAIIQAGPITTTAVDLGALQYTVPLLVSDDYNYTLAWTANDDTTVTMALQLIAKVPLGYSWLGASFASGMLEPAEMIVCHNDLLNSSRLTSHRNILLNYSPPLETSLLSIPIGGIATTYTHSCLFKTTASTTNLTPFIWSFNAASGTNYVGLKYTYHGNNKGTAKVQLNSGVFFPQTNQSFASKQTHGFGMMIVFLVGLPLGAFVARYARSYAGWLIFKVINQTVASILVFVFVAVIINGTPPGNFLQSHTYLGSIIIAFVGIQMTLGVVAVLGLTQDNIQKVRKVTKMTHRVLGYSTLILAVVQIGLGINILYPIVDPRELAPWVIYFLLLAFWLAAFGAAEWYYRRNIKRHDGGYTKTSDAVKLIVSIDKKEIPITTYTWEGLNEAIVGGMMLVVGDSNYVYDISKWITSHPGGQLILHSVNGTDISNDYFHTAGYDAAEFTPLIEAPEKKRREKKVNSNLTKAELIKAKRYSLVGSLKMDQIVSSFTQNDWSYILRSRRTHVHSKLAIQRLSSLVVGQMVLKNGASNVGAGIPFDVDEFRRYALTASDIESPPDATTPFVRLKFCLLYPYDIRENQPAKIQPGQCVEIQIRNRAGVRISRYYTVLYGNMNAFEVLIKIKVGGEMSPMLLKSLKGEKQFKIRGPFGSLLLPLYDSITAQKAEVIDTIFFFAGGSGTTPFLQLACHLMLSKDVPLKAAQAYSAVMTDELELTVGDDVIFKHHYLDGWAYAHNLTTGLMGTCPVGCIIPVAPIRLVLFSVSNLDADVMGSSLVEGARLAYPQLVEVHRFNSKTLTPEAVRPFLDEGVSNRLTVICGPDAMSSYVTDMLYSFGGNCGVNLQVMGKESYN